MAQHQFLGVLSRSEEKPTLEQAQSIVGGYVEMVNRGDYQILVNEEGMLQDLPLNEKASDMFGMPLYGPVLILEDKARWD